MIKQKVLKYIQSLSLTLLLSLITVSAAAQGGTSAPARNLQSVNLGHDSESTPAKVATTNKAVFLENDVVAYNDKPAPATEKAKPAATKSDVPKKKKKKTVAVVEEAAEDFSAIPYENYFARQIVNNALLFEGVPYRGGGTTTAGMDCSGMVFATFKMFDWTLPRSSASMAADAGHKVDLKEVRIGDLLFFDNSPYKNSINHVGLVTEVTPEGEVKFIHATLSHGVAISSMSDNYYIRTFVQANRVIED